MALKVVGIEDDGSFQGRARAWLEGKFQSSRLAQGPVSTGIHGSHTLPQHYHANGRDFIGGIEGEADADGNSWAVVDIIDYEKNTSTRIPMFKFPVDDHSPVACFEDIGFGEGHQVGRQVKVKNYWYDSDTEEWNYDEQQSLQIPKPSDTDGTATYVQAHKLQPLFLNTPEGHDDYLLFTRVAWHWFAGVARKNRATRVVTMATSWVDFITFRDPGAAAPGGDQGYINTYLRDDGYTLDVVAFGHPVMADDRNLYFCTINLLTGAVSGSTGNIYTGANLPLTRRGMENGYKRVANTNLRCLGVGGLVKRQALICKWNTSGGTTAAIPANNNYKLLTRGAVPTQVGANIAQNGHIATADRPEFTLSTGVDLTILLNPTTTRPSATVDLGSQWEPTGNLRAWRLFVNTTGTLAFSISADGTNAVTATSTVAMDATAANVKGIKVVYTAATGLTRFYTTANGTDWVQLGADVSVASTSMFNSPTSLKVGRVASGAGITLPGVYQRWTLRNGADGPIVADLQLDKGWANGESGTSRVDHIGNTWALQAGVIISAPEWTETADFGPTGDPVGYEDNIQYIADGYLMDARDDQALLARRLPGGLAQTVIIRQAFNGTVTEEVLLEELGVTHFRPRPVSGEEGSPVVGSASRLYQYGPTYVTFQSKPALLWKRGATVPTA